MTQELYDTIQAYKRDNQEQIAQDMVERSTRLAAEQAHAEWCRSQPTDALWVPEIKYLTKS